LIEWLTARIFLAEVPVRRGPKQQQNFLLCV
jgi:hypothetical protein